MFSPNKIISREYITENYSNILIVFLVLYLAFFNSKLPKFIVNLFENPIFRILLLSLIIYKGNDEPLLALMFAIVFIVTSNLVLNKKFFENFTQVGYLNKSSSGMQNSSMNSEDNMLNENNMNSEEDSFKQKNSFIKNKVNRLVDKVDKLEDNMNNEVESLKEKNNFIKNKVNRLEDKVARLKNRLNNDMSEYQDDDITEDSTYPTNEDSTDSMNVDNTSY